MSAPKLDKYASALLDLAKASKAVKDIQQRIGEALDASYKSSESTWPKDWNQWPEVPEEWRDLGGKNLWLHRAYKIEREHYGSGMFDDYYVNHDDDVRGYLAEHCEHALRAHDLIQDRKELRKALGIAKRRVTFLGNRLLAASQA